MNPKTEVIPDNHWYPTTLVALSDDTLGLYKSWEMALQSGNPHINKGCEHYDVKYNWNNGQIQLDMGDGHFITIADVSVSSDGKATGTSMVQ